MYERPALPRAEVLPPPQDGSPQEGSPEAESPQAEPRSNAAPAVALPPPNPAFLATAPEGDVPGGLAEGSQASTSVEPSLEWHATLQEDVVAVEFDDSSSRYRVEKVELLGPNGARIASAPLARTVERNFGYSTDVPPGTFVVGLFGGSAGLDGGVRGGIGHGFDNDPVGRGLDNRPLGIRDTGVPSKTTTRARITLADPAAYRKDVKDWKIWVELLDSNGETSHFEFSAPAP
ncbi:MAG TPA: hypothetical protein VEJ16_06925 [Alphaproteobacteria bacterium]|nr:hypothetical protein [Alphaproteobacteria bacterium]